MFDSGEEACSHYSCWAASSLSELLHLYTTCGLCCLSPTPARSLSSLFSLLVRIRESFRHMRRLHTQRLRAEAGGGWFPPSHAASCVCERDYLSPLRLSCARVVCLCICAKVVVAAPSDGRPECASIVFERDLVYRRCLYMAGDPTASRGYDPYPFSRHVHVYMCDHVLVACAFDTRT